MRRLRPEILLFAGLALAFLVRLAYLFQMTGTPLQYPELGVDSPLYIRSAYLMTQGQFAPSVPYESTQYPVFLAANFLAFGAQLNSVRLLQILLDTVTVLGVYMIGGLAGLKTPYRLLAAAAYALYGLAIFYTGFVLDTTLFTFFLTAAVWSFLSWRQKERQGVLFLSGLFFGASLLFKPHAIFCIAFLLGSLWLWGKKAALGKALRGLLFLAGILTALLPVSFKNHAAYGSWSPFPPSIFGIHFYMSYSPLANGFYQHIEGLSDTPGESVKESAALAEKETGRKMSEKEASAYWTKKGWDFIRTEPGKFLRLLAMKIGYFWNRKEFANNLEYDFLKGLIPLFRFPFFAFGVVGPLALVGLVMFLFRKSEGGTVARLVLLYMIAVTGLTFADRYRLPSVPLLLILAAAGLQECMAVKRVFVPALLLACLLVHRNIETPPMYRANSHYNLAVLYAEHGEKDKAAEEFRKTLEIFPADPDARRGLASL